MFDVKEMKKRTYSVRKKILEMANKCGKNAHIGGALSMADLLCVLYGSVMHYDFNNPEDSGNDVFVLSKGHCVMALYAVLNEYGLISDEELSTFQQNGSRLSSHPVMDKTIGIETSSGSLGQGISLAVGLAKSGKIQKSNRKIYTLIGNGESNEGSVWEAAAIAGQWGLDNFTLIMDNNGLQSDGESRDILNGSAEVARWESFGFQSIKINGNDVEAISDALNAPSIKDQPKIIIADTIKGKGVFFMENSNAWHHGRLTDELYEKAMAELEVAYA